MDKLPNTYYFKSQQMTGLGIPDYICCISGLFVAMELKVGKNKTSKLQEFNLGWIRSSGGIAWVVTPENWGEIWAKLLTLTEGKKE